MYIWYVYTHVFFEKVQRNEYQLQKIHNVWYSKRMQKLLLVLCGTRLRNFFGPSCLMFTYGNVHFHYNMKLFFLILWLVNLTKSVIYCSTKVMHLDSNSVYFTSHSCWVVRKLWRKIFWFVRFGSWLLSFSVIIPQKIVLCLLLVFMSWTAVWRRLKMTLHLGWNFSGLYSVKLSVMFCCWWHDNWQNR